MAATGAPAATEKRRAPATQTGLRRALALISHLTLRDIAVSNRFSFIGAGWPLLRQLAQLTVLVVAFSAVLDLGIPDYPAFVFCGLIGWTWFVTGITAAAASIRGSRELAMRPGFPTVVLPVVAIAVPLTDVGYALPVLLGLLAVSAELHATAPLLLLLLGVQGVLMVGLGWIVSALSVHFRDVPNIVGLVLLMGFYLTPVYFDVTRVPEDYQWLLRLNPIAVLLEADRAVLLGTDFPPGGTFAATVALAFVLFFAGLWLFRRMAPGFSDEL